ncbi:MAG: LytTR family transcriptional regulator [Bacteroidetes bacterium]|nr:LytTR family transcriptional regulator [Bacteroidota bacterium]
MKTPKILRQVKAENPLVYMQSDINYTVIYLKNGKKLISGYTLKHFEHLEGFRNLVRVNRHIILNSDFVVQISEKNKTHFLELENGMIFQLSRRQDRKVFKENFG